MRAVVFEGDHPTVQEIARPAPQGDQVLLRVQMAGICNTDLEIFAGYQGFTGVPGHEFVAYVVEGPEAWMGRRVTGEINVTDGTCDMCLAGLETHCRHRTTVGIRQHPGAFAEYLALTVRNLHPVDPSIPDEAAVFTEPLAAALQILEVISIKPTDRVVVIGAGKLGLLCAQVIRLTGAAVTVVIRRSAPAVLLQTWDIATCTLADSDPATADVVVDCTGNAAGFADALALVRPRGTLILKSTYIGLPQADLTQIAVREIRVVGSRCGSFPAALRLLKNRLVDVEALISARYSLADALTAFNHAAQPGMLKVLVTMG